MALARSLLDPHAMALEVLHRLLDRSLPDEAEVRVAGTDRVSGKGRGRVAGAVHVQLLIAEAVVAAGSARARDQLGAEDGAGEGVGAVPVGDRDHAVVEPNGHRSMVQARQASSAMPPSKARLGSLIRQGARGWRGARPAPVATSRTKWTQVPAASPRSASRARSRVRHAAAARA